MAELDSDEKQEIDQSQLQERSGDSGVMLVNGIITREEYNDALVGRKGLDKFDEMRRSDATVKGALKAAKLPITSVEWRVDPVDDDPRDQLAAQLCEQSVMGNVNFAEFMNQALTHLDFGFSLFEQVFDVMRMEGREYILLSDMGFRKQNSLVRWQTKEGESGITQTKVSGEEVSIPAFKLVHFAHDQEGDNFEGISVLRSAYKPWYMKTALEQIDALAHEKQGLGILTFSAPKGATEDDKAEARRIAREQRANEEGYIEKMEGWTWDFMDMKARSTRDPQPAIEYHNRQILQSVLAQFLTIGGGGSSSGSFSASDNQVDLYVKSLQNIASNMATRIQQSVFRNVLELNGLGDRELPKLVHDRISKDDISSYAEALVSIANANLVTADPEVERYLRDLMHLPEMSEELEENYDETRAMRQNPSSALSDENENPTASQLLARGNRIKKQLREVVHGDREY